MKYLIFLLLIPHFLFSQKEHFSATDIPEALKENANAVVRYNQINISILSQRNMLIKHTRVITVLNKFGLSAIDAIEYYDKSRKIVKIEATVFDAFGKEIKSIRKKDFRDSSVGDGFSIFNDNRILYLDYTAINYPFTIKFESEIETSNTAFIPTWYPVENYFVSSEKTILNVTFPKELGFQKKEINFSDKYAIEKKETENSITYEASNLTALKSEENNPDFTKLVPVVYLKVKKFNLEGIDGEANDWKEFGKWYYDAILLDTDELSKETQEKIKNLVGTETDRLKIAKMIYQFVQDKTRYVSIQVGLGGFKPMLAKDVDRLGYGDCKALVNYTRALLKTVGISSYYTIVHSGTNKKNLQEDFASVQGNHIILAVPHNNEILWLECTSQIQAFGFQGDFTDDRNVLMVKPEGGELVKTKLFLNKDNSQITKGSYTISSAGNLSGSLSIVSRGMQYDHSFSNERLAPDDKEKYYKSYFGVINNLKINNLSFDNDVENIAFTQNIKLTAAAYANINSDKLMFVLNAFNNYQGTPKRYRSRENPFEISRGYFDQDEIEVFIPDNYSVEVLPNNIDIKNKFGEYQIKISTKEDKTIIYTRTLLIKEGFYESKEYDEYRLFREQVAKNDNAKIILTKKT